MFLIYLKIGTQIFIICHFQIGKRTLSINEIAYFYDKSNGGDVR